MEAKTKELLDSHRTELEEMAGEKTTVERVLRFSITSGFIQSITTTQHGTGEQ